ncbi:MAG TPA: GNAT family N-acetyltransferase [Edaphocola sp.]|nr:GNAT family N-acetyltransferase [Edaphocola sp.]
MKIKRVEYSNLKVIINIAKMTWPLAYANILSKDQIDYMLNKFYSLEILQKNFKNQYYQYLCFHEVNEVGFIEIELNYKQSVAKIHKLYVLPAYQKHGYGKNLILMTIGLAKEHNQESIILNVNRNNIALDFYRSIGFEIIYEEDIDIGENYFMNDYVMEYKIDQY